MPNHWNSPKEVWTLKFVWWPQICELTDKLLWLCFAYRGTMFWTGPGEPMIETRWHHKNEHILWRLKN